MLGRRDFLAFAAAAPALASIPARRAGNVEIVFKSPDPHPNGLQATEQGLWIMDQGEGSRVYLVRYEDGKVLREFSTEADKASGITFDGEALWLASTYDRSLIRADAMTGKTIEKYFTPGAGPIYSMAGDPPPRTSPLAKQPEPSKPVKPNAHGIPKQPPGGIAGTGAHGLEWRNGNLFAAVPPARTIFRLDPKSWVVQQKFATAANRPHGIGWEGKYLWATDSNLNAFFKHDPDTGEMVEKIQLSDRDPLPHGMTIWRGMMWYCDDVGVVCRLKL